MKIADLAELLGKTRAEIEEILKNNDIIELKLSERKLRYKEKVDDLKIYE